MRVANALFLFALAAPAAQAAVSTLTVSGRVFDVFHTLRQVTTTVEYDDALPVPSIALIPPPHPSDPSHSIGVNFLWDVPDIEFGDISAHFGVHVHALSIPDRRWGGGPWQLGANISEPKPAGIRFSLPIDQAEAVLTRLDTGAVIQTSDRLQVKSGGFGDWGVDFTEHYVPNHALFASSDPSCASFDCMIPGQDLKILRSYQLSVGWDLMTPEPGTYVLFAAGVGLLVLLRYRRA